MLPFATCVLLTGVLWTTEVSALLASGIWPVLEIGYTVPHRRLFREPDALKRGPGQRSG